MDCKYCQKPVSRLQIKPWGNAHVRCYTKVYRARKLFKQQYEMGQLYHQWIEAGGKPEILK